MYFMLCSYLGHAKMIFIKFAKYHATLKISFNLVKYIMNLSKYGATFRNISCNLEACIFPTCLMSHGCSALLVVKVDGKRETVINTTPSHGKAMQVIMYFINLEYLLGLYFSIALLQMSYL